MNAIRLFLSALTLVALAMHLPGEAAEGCRLIKIGELPLRPNRGALVTEGQVNGKNVGVFIDTGAYSTSIMGPAATKLGLQLDNAPRYELYGVGGETRVHSAVVDELRIGSATRRDFRMQVVGEREFGSDIAIGLGADFFANMDVEFDLPNHVVRLFAAQDCEGKPLAYWAPADAGVVPIDAPWGIVFPVRINGSELSAMLDSGATTSVLSEPIAAGLGMRPDSPEATPAGCAVGYGRKAVEMWVAPFERFVIGDEVIRNPRLRVSDFWRNISYRRAGSGMVHGRQSGWDMILGADFLATHRVLVSNSQKRMYFTYSGGIVFPVVQSLGCGEPVLARDVDGRIAEYDAALARDPSDAKAMYGRAVAFAQKKAYDRALADYDATLRIEPRNAAALVLRSGVHAAMKNFDRALADIDAALALGARHGSLYVDRGNVLRAKGDTDGALAEYARARELDPLGWNAYFARAQLWYSRKEYDKALADYDAAIRNGAQNVAAYAERGRVWRDKGDIDRAIADYTKAIEADPRNAWPLLLRSGGWQVRREPEKAVADCDAALAIDPKYPSALRRCSLLKFDLGRHELAGRDFARLMTLDPTGEHAVWLFIARERGGKDGRAELRKFAEETKEAGWPAPIVRFHLGQLDREQLLAAAMTTDPKVRRKQECEANFHIGEQRLIAGDRASAVPYLKKAEAECPAYFVELDSATAELGRAN